MCSKSITLYWSQLENLFFPLHIRQSLLPRFNCCWKQFLMYKWYDQFSEFQLSMTHLTHSLECVYDYKPALQKKIHFEDIKCISHILTCHEKNQNLSSFSLLLLSWWLFRGMMQIGNFISSCQKSYCFWRGTMFSSPAYRPYYTFQWLTKFSRNWIQTRMSKNLICSVVFDFIIPITLKRWLYSKKLGTDINVCETEALGSF